MGRAGCILGRDKGIYAYITGEADRDRSPLSLLLQAAREVWSNKRRTSGSRRSPATRQRLFTTDFRGVTVVRSRITPWRSASDPLSALIAYKSGGWYYSLGPSRVRICIGSRLPAASRRVASRFASSPRLTDSPAPHAPPFINIATVWPIYGNDI